MMETTPEGWRKRLPFGVLHFAPVLIERMRHGCVHVFDVS
jgi:hypothetical protein